MQCITCNKEIPDASNVCPFCNNKVEPLITASEALGVAPNVLPTTPSEYKLPKDQVTATQSSEVVNQDMPVNTTDILPPPPPTIEEENKVEEESAETDTTEDIGTISAHPAVDVSSINIENLDLNANAQAQSLDLTKENLGDKISNEAVPTKTKKKITKKTIILLVVCLLVIGLGIGGFMFYKKEYKSSAERIKTSINRLFSFTNTIPNTEYINGTGSYELSYSHGNDTNKVVLELDGKYGYDIKNKKIDVIANIKKYQNKDVNIDTELNTELYLDDNRVYFLLQNFSDNYVYMDVKDAPAVIDDVKSRFNNPDELFIFKNINYLFDNGLKEFTNSYSTYINNASTNEVNYTNIMSGLKLAVSNALISLPSTQKIESGDNIIRITLNSADKVKKLVNSINEQLHNNIAKEELNKIFGDDFYNHFKTIIDNYEFKAINGDIVIATDLFKGNLKYMVIPTLKDDKVVNTKITPVANGYKVVSTCEGKEIINITYNKSSSSTSTVNSKVYKITGSIVEGDETNNIDITLKLSKDNVPGEVLVVTRNSIDYKYLTVTDFAQIAEKMSNTPGFGELFKSVYKGIVVEDSSFTGEQQEGA